LSAKLKLHANYTLVNQHLALLKTSAWKASVKFSGKQGKISGKTQTMNLTDAFQAHVSNTAER